MTKLVWIILFLLAASTAWADMIYLKDGSIINGTIVENNPTSALKVRIYDGSTLALARDQISNIKYGKAYTPKSGALACVLSLIYPGVGHFYLGQTKKGLVYCALGTVGLAVMFKGLNKSTEAFWSSRHDGSDSGEAIGGAIIFVGSSWVSAITSIYDARPPLTNNTKLSLLSYSF